MKLQNQVCTEQQADRLKELGVTQDSLFYHTHSDWGVMPKKSIDFSGDPSSAFTVAELGAMLGPFAHYLQKSDRNDYWYISLDNYQQFKTEAEGRAAIVIYRLEKGAITAAEVNHLLLNA